MNNSVSLLYRPGFKKAGPENIKGLLQEMLQEDLNVDKILDSLFRRGKCKKKEALLDTLMDWETDTENIEYRLDIMEEVFKKPGILKRILEVIAHTEAFAGDRRVVVSYHRANSFRQIKSGAEHLLLYLETLEMLARALGSKGQYESEGLQNLAQYAIGYVTSEDYKQLQAILQMIQAGGSSLFNLKLSVRRSLNFQLRTATLVEINHETLYQPGIAESNSVLDGLFRRNRGKPNESFITEPKFIGQRCVGEAAEKSLYHLGGYISGISSALARFFIRLEKEIYFYVAAVELLQVLEDAGLPLCRPQIAPYKEKQFSATGVYDLSFAFYLIPRKEFSPENIVRNKVAMNDEQGQIFVVTGPNQGERLPISGRWA